jgi:hypothetical protein
MKETKGGRNRNIFNNTILMILCLTAVISFACADERILKSNKNAATPISSENSKTSFESDLETMKTANFEFIYVFRRRDGGAFDAEDRKYLINNKPPQINRFVLTGESKAFIAGSKYRFPEENLKNIKMRFDVEDLSAIGAKEPENTVQEPGKEKSNASK